MKKSIPVLNIKLNAIIITLLSISIAGCILFSIMSLVAKSRYWKAPHLQELVVDMSKYEDYLNEHSSDYNGAEEIVIQRNMEAEPVSNICTSFINECNEIINKYFSEVYSVDVIKKLDKLQIMSATYPEEISGTVGGSYYKDVPELSEKLFINSALLNNFIADISIEKTSSAYDNEPFSFKMLRTVYIHEAIHYLGFTNDPLLDYFEEAITEYLTEMTMTYSGIKYENITGYGEIRKLASQIIESDSTIVSSVLKGEHFSMGDYFNEKLGKDYSATYDCLVFMLQNGGADTYKEIPYLAQYITYEYVKVASNNIESSLASAHPSITHNFEVKWLLGMYE